MKRIAIYGAGGFGKEVRGMLDALPDKFYFAGYIDDFKDIDEKIADQNYDDVLMAIANPSVRQKLVEQWTLKRVDFFSCLSPDVQPHHSVKIGRGSIICPGVKMTVDIKIGEFVIINLNSTIGHDSTIGDFSSLMPSVNISGNVTIGRGTFVGSGATILQGITIGDNVIIGAGSLVNKNVADNSVVMGVPARKKNDRL
jgi:sugar O-acyltransferase (sialic acid O-acetyltransferase NeuD family)